MCLNLKIAPGAAMTLKWLALKFRWRPDPKILPSSVPESAEPFISTIQDKESLRKERL
jgi:hypothetical protein